MSKPRVIAFYLPQFHPTPDNDEWWGKGFTEWTNVGKAKKLFPGHEQPKIPADLGYYDLRIPEVREEQAKLAKEAGVEGFCYWHYWFGNNKELLERPFKEVVKSKSPDFPFCLGWANESWKKKLWNQDSSGDTVIQLQDYGGTEDYTAHFYSVLDAFKDERYIKVHNKPLFLIYKPFDSPKVKDFMECWNKLAEKEGLEGIFWVAHCLNEQHSYDEYRQMGFEYINTCYLLRFFENRNFLRKVRDSFYSKVLRYPRIVKYLKAAPYFNKDEDLNDSKILPSIVAGWDHTPRSGKKGVVMTDYTPQTFKSVVNKLFSKIKNRNPDENIVFLKSWNEWGEGNYIEPDLKYGKKFLEALREEIDNI